MSAVCDRSAGAKSSSDVAHVGKLLLTGSGSSATAAKRNLLIKLAQKTRTSSGFGDSGGVPETPNPLISCSGPVYCGPLPSRTQGPNKVHNWYESPMWGSSMSITAKTVHECIGHAKRCVPQGRWGVRFQKSWDDAANGNRNRFAPSGCVRTIRI